MACCAGALGGCPQERASGRGGGAMREGLRQRRTCPLSKGAGKEGEGEPKGADGWTGAASPSPRSEVP